MKARKGFIYTAFALLIALFLALASAYLLQLGAWTLKEEARMTLETDYSLYPLAWSTTNYVLQSLKGVYEGDTAPHFNDAKTVFLNGVTSAVSSDLTFTVQIGSAGNPLFVSCDVKLTGNSSKINVESKAYAVGYGAVTVKGSLKNESTGWAILWR